MPNEMVERVAKAIALRFAPAIDFKAPYAKIMLDSAAKLAIEAMREPTEAMEEAANKRGSLEEGSSSYGCWQAMIDAALKDG